MTSEHRKHTKQCRFYVPGLISLFLFFPLALFQLQQYGAFEKSYALEVNWYSPELVDLQFPPARQFQVISLNGNKRDDDIKLDFAQIAIREMRARNDTVNGVRVHFTDAIHMYTLKVIPQLNKTFCSVHCSVLTTNQMSHYTDAYLQLFPSVSCRF